MEEQNQQAQQPISTETNSQPNLKQKNSLSIKTKIVGWLIIIINLYGLYYVANFVYFWVIMLSVQYDLNRPMHLPWLQITYYLTSIIIAIFLLKNKKWAWWVYVVLLIWITTSSLLGLIVQNVKFLHLYQLTLDPVSPRLLAMYDWSYRNTVLYEFLVAATLLILLLSDRKKFLQSITPDSNSR
jgi:hypothetical protein